MLRLRFVLPVLMLTTVGLLGCTGGDPAPSADAPAGGAASGKSDPKIEAALAELSPSDRALAEKQKICPVTDELLGSMGPPKKVTIEGRDILICCDGCEDAVREDPETYFAKIEAAGGTVQ
jgi:hypothetical protein